MGAGGPSGWADVLLHEGGERHLVQLYHDDRSLVRAVAFWAGEALRSGGGAIVIGTRPHRDAIRQALADGGLEVEALVREERLLLADADATLARFRRDGCLDAERFHAVVGDAVARAGAGGRREVRAWGEMVDLLARRGDPAGAMALEDLWNDAIAAGGLRLLCSYEADPFDHSLYAARFRVYAHGHDRLVPPEDQPFLDAAVEVAMRHVCGDREAESLAASLEARPLAGIDLEMPRAQRLLAAMSQVLPDYGRKVLVRAGAHYRVRGPGPGA